MKLAWICGVGATPIPRPTWPIVEDEGTMQDMGVAQAVVVAMVVVGAMAAAITSSTLHATTTMVAMEATATTTVGLLHAQHAECVTRRHTQQIFAGIASRRIIIPGRGMCRLQRRCTMSIPTGTPIPALPTTSLES